MKYYLTVNKTVVSAMSEIIFFSSSFQLGHRAARLRPRLGRRGVCQQAEKEDGDQLAAV